MDAEARAKARQQVAGLLIDRLNAAGMIRPKSVTLDVHAAMLKRLTHRLAYMARENLMTLAEILIEAGQDSARNIWPCEATVIARANDLQRCPIAEHRVVYSWLASIEGPAALAAGIEVELYWYLASQRKPPINGADNRKIAEEARENAHHLAMIQDRIERGAASADDRQWAVWYLRERDHVRRIIKAGENKRAAA